ncbi:MAG: damage-inducible protein DinB [Alphaproteobacteria bacterium]|nr:damage-inducible protein DinB [Alphaproteobacteria bacterium]
MIGIDYVRRMALYNRWQNENLYGAADRLTDEERHRDRGAFFGSIHRTMCHLLWADQTWMSRFRGAPPPVALAELAEQYRDWVPLQSRRRDLDDEIERWAEGLAAEWLAGNHTHFSPSFAREVTNPRWLLVSHFFNHQPHHREQILCMLTQAGRKPGDTDLPMMPD